MANTVNRLRVYVGTCMFVAGLTGFAVFKADSRFSLPEALGFGLLIFLAEQYPITHSRFGTSYSVSFVITIAAITAVGPAEAMVATLFGTLSLTRASHLRLIRHVFNAAQLSITAGIGGLTYWASGGIVGSTDVSVRNVVFPLFLCTAANFVVNTSLVSGAVGISEGRRAREVWGSSYRTLGRSYVAFALLGLLLGVLYLQMGWPAVAFFLLPLLVARSAFQAAIEMQGAYDDTVRSLVSFIEAKDPYTRGHAERVARLAEMIARVYGLSEERCRAIRYAALMHDVGKLGVLNSILQKPGKLTPEEYEHMKQHPLRGVEIVGEIDLLEEAIVAVRHHHERLDGQGYPDGLKGTQIPLFARIITVADAFDSMTSTRTYRRAMTIEQGIGELHRCEGTQFDPRAIEALEQALQRFGWTPAPEPRDEEPAKDVKDARAASL